MKTKILLTTAILLFLNLLESQAQIWEQTNGPYGGIIWSSAVHPSGIVYTSMYRGALYRSTNDGDSWFPSGLNGKEVDNIFVSTTGFIFITSHYRYIDEFGNIIWVTEPYRSTDNGENWNIVNVSVETTDCWAEDQDGNLYVDGWNSPGGGFKILKSTDGGENWVLWSYHSLGSSNDFLFFDSYIFRSDESNGIWQLINNSWVKRFPSQSGGLGTSCIERTPTGVLLAGTQTPGQGVYRSLDSAANWERIYSAGIENTMVKSIIIDSDGIVFAATSNGIFKSTDEGETWVQYGLQNSSVRTIVLTSSDVLLAGNDFGMHRWIDGINGWEEANIGLYVNRTYSLVVNQTTSSFFAATNTGLFRTTDNGEFWEFVLSADYGEEWIGTLNKTALLFDVQSNSLFTADFQEFHRSTDDGNTWITSSLPFNSDILCLENGSEPGIIFGGGASYPDWRYTTFFYSSDYGENWSQTFLGGPGGPPLGCLATNEISDYLFAGTEGSGIYRSTDQGAFWRTFNVGLVNTNVQSIATNSAGDIFLGTYNGVFRSRDQGGNWTWVGLGSDTVLVLAINSVGNVLAGTFNGQVYKSNDDGDSWFDFSDGLKFTTVRSLIVDENDIAFVGTVSEGVFRTIHTTVDVDENDDKIPNEFSLSQNYPNPFNPSTKIKYSIPYSSKVFIKVFDILGNEIETLVNEEKSVGTYELTWNATNLPSGVYFYQLKAGSFIETKKMILLK